MTIIGYAMSMLWCTFIIGGAAAVIKLSDGPPYRISRREGLTILIFAALLSAVPVSAILMVR